MRLARHRHIPASPPRAHRIAVALLAGVLIATTVTTVASAATRPAAAPSVINFWNNVTMKVVVTDNGKAAPEVFMWSAFESAAVYNAVVGITGRYQRYKWNPAVGPGQGASPQAAAASAAYHLLFRYFSATSGARLNAAYATSLALIPNGRAKTLGIDWGRRAAARIAKLRVGDGRNAVLPFTMPVGPGVWRPTSAAGFQNTWLSELRPLAINSPEQFRPGPPPALTSAQYAAEFNEVKSLGQAGSSTRTAAQTETAKFFSDIAPVALQQSLREMARRRGMNISDRARLFAAVNVSITDTLITVWDAKFHYGLWRPITAIREAATDGNDATVADPAWTSLIPAPPYPDYTSGLTGVIGAMTRSISRVIRDPGRVSLNITSTAAGLPGPPLTRHYEFAGRLNRDAINARIWSGIHFRTADVLGNRQGRLVADWILDRYFKPRT
jgi:hypothetical protein